MAEPISEDLGFDISGALQGIGQIDDALQQVIQSFSVGLATALEQLIGVGADVTPLAESLDVAGLGPAIDTALTDAQSGITVPVEADTSAVGPEIADAVDQPQTVPVDADTAEAQTAIGDLDQPVVVPVDADTASAQAAVDEVAAAPITVPVDADTTDAETAIGALDVTPQTIPVDADTSQAADAIAALGTETPVTVPVDGDVSGLSDAIETATTVTPVIPVDADVTDAQAQIDALAAVPVDVPVAADTTVAQDAIDQLGLAAPIDIPVSADTAQAETDIAQLGGDVTVPVDADTAEAEAQIAGLGDPITVPVEGDTADLSDAIDTATQVSATIPVDADTSQAEASIEALATVPPVDVPVSADTAGAEAEIEQLGLGVSVDVPVSADTSAAESEIAGLGTGSEVTVPVDADTSALSDAIDNAAAVSPVIPLEGDAAGLTEAIDTATAVSPVIDVSADTSEAQAAIDALAATPIDLPIAVDTAEAQAAIDDLGASATGATGGGSSGLAGLEGAVLGVKAATGAATGDVSGLTGVIGGLSSGLGEAAIGGAAFGAFIGETTKLAADAEAQQKRFNDTFGASAAIVKNIDVGGLNISLEELGKQSGTATANLEASASRIGLLGTSSGVAQPKVAKVTQEILGLGATLSVNNPRLGDASEVADRLFTALTRGGRAAQQLGLNVPTKQIQALAQEIAGAGNEVSQFDKLQAGLQLALAGFGDTLGGKFADGAQNAQVQLRALKVELEETLVAIGKPLLQPVVESLRSLLPVAEDSGRVLGGLAQVTLPFIEALGPALALVDPPLRLIAAGLGKIADVVGLIPQPVLVAGEALIGLGTAAGILGAAITALGIGAGLGTAALIGLGSAGEALGAAFTVALGPVGLVVAGLAIVGSVLGVFSSESKQAKLDTAGLGEALFGTAKSADELSSALSSTNTNLASYLATQLKTGKGAEDNTDAISKLKLSYSDLATAVSGSEDSFFTFTDSIRKHATEVGLADNETNTFIHSLFVQRDTLQATAGAQLDQLFATHQITQAQLDQIRSQNGINDAVAGSAEAVGDNVAALREGTRAAVENERATVAQGLAAGSLQRAFLDLKPAIAAGTLTADDAQQVADQLGISLEDAKAAVDSLSTAMDAFVTQGLSALPSAGAAIDTFASGIASAKSALDQALSAEGAPNASGADAISRAQESANRAISDNAEKTARTVAEAQRKVDTARQGLAEAEAQSGTGQAAAIRSAEGKLQTALDALTRTRERAGQSQADAVRSGSRKISDAQDAANQSQSDAAQKAKEAQDAYAKAIDPQRIIDAQNAQTFAILTFQANIDALIKRGRLNVAAQLVQEGPEKGGAFAAALVSNDALAQAEDRGLQLGTKVRTGYRQDLETHKAELSGILVTLANGQVVPLANTYSHLGATAGSKFVSGIADGLGAVNPNAKVTEARRRLIEGGGRAEVQSGASAAKIAGERAGTDAQTGFATNFHPDAAATTAIGKVPAAITNGLGPINNAATTAADQIAERFHPDFAAQIFPAMLAVLTSIDQGVTDVKPFVGQEGAALGQAFGAGFADGLTLSSPGVTFAAGLLADEAVAAIRKALGIKSPSSEGIDIGSQFVAGIVQGLERLDPLHRATAALALALVPDLRPALRQVPSLAPAISAAASHAVAAPAVVSNPPGATAGTTRKDVSVKVDLHKVDVNPKLLADEIAWTIA